MKLKIFAAVLAVALAGCEPSETQRIYVQEHLPKGCELKDLGSYGSIDLLVVVVCDGRTATVSNTAWHYQCGKNTCRREGAAIYIHAD